MRLSVLASRVALSAALAGCYGGEPGGAVAPGDGQIRCAPNARFQPGYGCVDAVGERGLRVVLHSEVGASFRLLAASVAIDRRMIFEGEVASMPMELYQGALPSTGEHELAVKLRYQGQGAGVLSYLNGYRFVVSSRIGWVPGGGGGCTMEVVGFEEGGPTVPLEQRLKVRYLLGGDCQVIQR
jgi:hypothetical protein